MVDGTQLTADRCATVSTTSGKVEPAHAVEVRNASKDFGNHKAIKKVDLTVDSGSVVALIGPSGSGKSTLCRCINQLEKIDSGLIKTLDVDLPLEGKAVVALRARVGMVFQSFNLFPHMTVLENVTLGPRKVKGMNPAAAEALAMELLARTGIENQAKKSPMDLSGGQQQRVAIARALAMEPELMLFDEPTSALDPETVRGVLEIIAELARSGMTMVIVTHEMGFARSVADEIVFMDNGQIVEQNSPAAFFDAPRTPRAQKFLAEVLGH